MLQLNLLCSQGLICMQHAMMAKAAAWAEVQMLAALDSGIINFRTTFCHALQGFIYMEHAIIAKAAAWAEVQTLTAFDDGNSKTNTLWWVATRPP